MGNREAKFKKVFEEIDMNGDHKVSFFELAAFIISPKAVHELEEFTKALFINNVSLWWESQIREQMSGPEIS